MLNLFANEEENGLNQIHQIAQATNIYKFVHVNMLGEFCIHYNLTCLWPDPSLFRQKQIMDSETPVYDVHNQDPAQ